MLIPYTYVHNSSETVALFVILCSSCYEDNLEKHLKKCPKRPELRPVSCFLLFLMSTQQFSKVKYLVLILIHLPIVVRRDKISHNILVITTCIRVHSKIFKRSCFLHLFLKMYFFTAFAELSEYASLVQHQKEVYFNTLIGL